MVFTDGLLVTTNCALQIAANTFATGRVTVVNSIVQAGDVIIAGPGSFNRGAFEIFGGTTTLLSSLEMGKSGLDARGVLTVRNGGLLVVTNGTVYAGNGATDSSGSITVSNATFLAAEVRLGPGFRSSGVLTVDSGTVTLKGALLLGSSQSEGQVFVNDGVLAVTNAATNLGFGSGPAGGHGTVKISGGVFLTRELLVGTDFGSVGSLTVNGGTALVNSNLQVGNSGATSARVLLSGGHLIVTNGTILVSVSTTGEETLKVSNGYLAARTIDLGTYGAVGTSAGTLSIYGGSMTVSAGITLGEDCTNNHAGFAFINGGQSFVTNAAADAFIDVRNGRMEINDGSLTVDKIVVTNSCGQFLHYGGVLNVASLILDPGLDADGDGIPNGYEQVHGFDPLSSADANADTDGDGFSNLQEYLAGTNPNDPSDKPLRITAIAQESNNIRITWRTAAGTTNALQATDGTGGSYSPNGFADIFAVTNATGMVTNYLDVGAATNAPSRYYRVHLVP